MQTDDAMEEDTWSPGATKFLEDVGHTVTVTNDAEAFLAELRDGKFRVLMIKPIDEARRLMAEIAAVAPDSVVLPIFWTPTRSERMAAEREFDRVLVLPTVLEDLLGAIDEARRAR